MQLIILKVTLKEHPKSNNWSAERGLSFKGVKIYNALPTHLKTEKFYLPFKQEEETQRMFYGLIII